MNDFVTAVRGALQTGNLYAALTVALTLPDICGRLEKPNARSRKRYIDWCDGYLKPRYSGPVGNTETEILTFLGGNDCYALRCAVLHEGRDEIVDQKAREAIDKFVFVTPIDGNEDHCVFIDGFIVLSVSIFCEDVCQGVEEWLAHVVATRPDIQSRIDGLMRIFTPPSSGVMGST